MDMHARMLGRQWNALTYIDPEPLLREMRRLELRLPGVRLRRTRKLNPHLQRRQAALFCYGLGRRLGTTVAFAQAPEENLPYDFVLTFGFGDTRHFWPLQLKELPPHAVSPSATLDAILAKLAKYGRALDLCVAIYMDRRLPALRSAAHEIGVGSLWLFGGIEPTHHRWVLQGDFKRPDCCATEFVYPEP